MSSICVEGCVLSDFHDYPSLVKGESHGILLCNNRCAAVLVAYKNCLLNRLTAV